MAAQFREFCVRHPVVPDWHPTCQSGQWISGGWLWPAGQSGEIRRNYDRNRCVGCSTIVEAVRAVGFAGQCRNDHAIGLADFRRRFPHGRFVLQYWHERPRMVPAQTRRQRRHSMDARLPLQRHRKPHRHAPIARWHLYRGIYD